VVEDLHRYVPQTVPRVLLFIEEEQIVLFASYRNLQPRHVPRQSNSENRASGANDRICWLGEIGRMDFHYADEVIQGTAA